MTLQRRSFVFAGAALGLSLGVGWLTSTRKSAVAGEAGFEIELSPEQWRERLTPEQFAILREAGTERPFSSPLDSEHRAGIFACAGCALPLFDSAAKFDSGTGWPSFYQPLPDAVGQSTDTTFGMVRDEIHCRRCGGHLGHVFADGPPPTGLRYCMNGVSLVFLPNSA